MTGPCLARAWRGIKVDRGLEDTGERLVLLVVVPGHFCVYTGGGSPIRHVAPGNVEEAGVVMVLEQVRNSGMGLGHVCG